MNNYNLNGRRAIVTGGAQGFGFAITKRFLESGAEVIIWDIDQKAVDTKISLLFNPPKIQFVIFFAGKSIL